MRRSLLAHAAWIACLWGGEADAQSWKRVSGVDSTRGVYALARQDGAFYAVSDTLVYQSANGTVWSPTTSQPPARFGGYSLLGNSTGLYVGTVQDGVSRTTDGGKSWHRPASGLDANSVVGLAALGDTVYAATGEAGVYGFNSRSGGASFSYNSGLFQSGSTAIAATSGGLLAGVGNYLFARPRGAAEWTSVNTEPSQVQVFDLLSTGKVVYAGTDKGVFRTSGDSANLLAWRSADIGAMKGRYITALAVQGSRVYAGLNYSGQHWIWSTDDGGTTWDIRAHEFTDLWNLMVAGNRMWAAREDGLWYYDLDPVSVRPAERVARPDKKPGFRIFDGTSTRRLDGRRAREASLAR